jgi:Fic family protein
MAIQVIRRWDPAPGSGLPRRDLAGCEYKAYVPDLLAERTFLLEGKVAADVAEGEGAIQRLNLEAAALADSEAVARLLLRAEAVASSKIEGLEAGGRRLFRAEAARVLGDDAVDVTAEEILGNIAAMAWAVEALADAKAIKVEHLLELHRRLLANTRLDVHAGVMRDSQNWIGGSSYNPCSAAFVPPPPEDLPRLLADLIAFCNGDDLSPVVQAAIAHAQFETIHPFVDGNGRAGRALIHVILRRRGLASRVLVPVSLVLATWSRDYIEGLTATRYVGDAELPEAIDGLNRWVGLFASACGRAVIDAQIYEKRFAGLQHEWRQRLGLPRKGSASDRLIGALPGSPILTVSVAAALIGRSFQATNQAVGQMVQVGILRTVKVGRRNRAFEAPDVVDAFNDLERRLASPAGDTLTSPAVRRVPRRSTS